MTSATPRSPGRAALALLSALALALTLLPPIGTSASAVEASTDVWINEFHYDNDGTDEGEFIEVAAAEGTDLSGWSIVRYNGANGSVYDSPAGPEDDLGALTATGRSGGFEFVVVEYPLNGLQNGAPDGLALVDPAGEVVQFLSYEGTFDAVDGPADGLTSTDVGVAQTGAKTLDPVGASLQLTGTGSAYTDFVWERTTENTAGATNTGQIFQAATGPVDVWLNEFHYDNEGGDVGEFIEVAATVGTDLSGWSIALYNGRNGTVYGTTSIEGLPATGAVNGFEFIEVPISGLQNGSPDGFALVDADDAVVQFLSYEGEITATGGPADGMTSSDVGVSETGSTLVGESLQLEGSGSSYDDFTWTGPITKTPGAANTGQTLGDGPVNAPIVPVCEDLTVTAGAGGSVELAASDDDGLVTSSSASLPSGLTLENEVAATEAGGTYSVQLTADGTLAFGDYSVDVTFANDDADAQTADCAVEVSVRGDVCQVQSGDLTLINEIQGSGDTTPIDGESVTTRGVVTADFTSGGASGLPNNQGLRGFFIEAIEVDRDEDAQTSEGVFVFDFDGTFDGAVGELVYVSGTAGEFSRVTQVASGDVAVCADIDVETTLPSAADLPLPTSPDDRGPAFEPTESMRVTHPELTVVEFFQLERFGEVRLSSDGTLQNPTNVVDSDDDAAYEALVASNAANNITLDDGRTGQNLDPLPYVTEGDTLRIGDQAIDETFVLHFGFGDWRLQPVDIDELTEEFRTNRTRLRPETPPEVGGSLTVGAFNVLNYFNGDGYFVGDDPATATGFPTARGARNVGEFERQTEKIVDAVVRMDADILGLIEIENDGGDDQAAAALVDAINTEAGAGTYDYIDTGEIGTDAIKLAFIYKPSTVEPTGDHAVLDSSVDPRFIDTKNRPVLAQSFTELATGESITVANNHLKSKGSGCGEGDDDPRQGSCNLTRTNAAAALSDWLADDPTGQDAIGTMIVGDLNSYAKEDPITELQGAGYTDLLDAFAEDGVMPYTYTFDATQGYLDHALADAELREFVTGTAAWNINADEVVAIDYYLSTDGRFRTADVAARFYDDSAFRSSDHDPVLVGLDLLLASPASCEEGRWQGDFPDGRSFRNQGQCVSFVASGELRGPGSPPGRSNAGRG